MINALSVDVEHWYCNEFLTKYLPDEKVDQVVESVMPILDLLDKLDVKGTFFVLGTVAEKHPKIVRTIFEKGHEIASHGYSHKMLHNLNRKEFEREIVMSIKLLEGITGKKPEGFRAPSWSLDNSTRWALEVLQKYGFKYDASIFPMRTNLYGVPGAPLRPYKPSFEDVTREDPNGSLLEFPMTVIKIGMNLPVTGGFYLRSLPLWFQKFAIRKVNRERPAMLYIHPWETYSKTPRLPVSLFSRFVVYHGSNSALSKFEALLKEFRFAPVNKVLSEALP